MVEYIETIENENGKIKLCSPPRYCFLAFLTRFYRFGFSLFILLSLSLPGFSQPGGEFGIIGGGSYYLGDYNPTKHFNSTQTYWGGFYRYNFNDRFALRFNGRFFQNRFEEYTPARQFRKIVPDGISYFCKRY